MQKTTTTTTTTTKTTATTKHAFLTNKINRIYLDIKIKYDDRERNKEKKKSPND